jgi:hypothetical protein
LLSEGYRMKPLFRQLMKSLYEIRIKGKLS